MKKSCPIPAVYRPYTPPYIAGREWWRLEIHGRPGWFVPAFEAALPEGTDESAARHALATALESFGYSPDQEGGESFHLRRL